jgi:signal transduction histidine kinase
MNPSGAEEADRAGLKVVANISHELRTPLAAIVGMTEVALLEELTPKVRDYLQTAKDSAEVLLRLLNDILDFSKMGAGGFALESSPFRLRAVLDETMR